jgi:CysZ protein
MLILGSLFLEDSKVKNSLIVFKPSFQILFKDKVNLTLAFIPVFIGVVLYGLLGTWLFGTLVEQGTKWIEELSGSGAVGGVFTWILGAIFTVILYFVVSWTFVLIITILASPFNDMLSRRVEKISKGQELETFAASFAIIGSTFIMTLGNEIKKVSFILILSLVAFSLGYIPLLTPISILISVLLLAIGFVDYSWSRHNIPFKNCFSDVKKNIINYSFGGGFFFILVTIPIVNLIVSSWATSYFTLLWVRNNESGH